jgi:hypothetical protein
MTSQCWASSFIEKKISSSPPDENDGGDNCEQRAMLGGAIEGLDKAWIRSSARIGRREASHASCTVSQRGSLHLRPMLNSNEIERNYDPRDKLTHRRV